MAGEISQENLLVENGQSGATASTCRRSMNICNEEAMATAIQENPPHDGSVFAFAPRGIRENRNAARVKTITNDSE